ncbi:uncharacterized protein LOC133190861 [Saccostrea echinata]|uniref:uncharacterized protein LOC133190861 n=1 Tax=Saccostrea echinata TaxID=191078 RepID=UPI002A833A89|nr:uncharacterized protein LOC133190861 [Saccostrea echinata]
MRIATFVIALLLIPAGPATIPEMPDMYEFVQSMWNMTTQATWHISQTLFSVDEMVFNFSASLATSSVCALDSLSTFALTLSSNTLSMFIDILDYVETLSVQFSDDAIRVSSCVYSCFGKTVSSVSSLVGFGLDFVQKALSMSVQELFLVRDILSSISSKGIIRLSAFSSFMALCVSLVWMVLDFRGRIDVMHKTVASLAEENKQLKWKISVEFKAMGEQRKEKEQTLKELEKRSKALSMWINIYTTELSRKIEKQSAGQFLRRSLRRQNLL